MAKGFFLKLATNNLKRNRKNIIPYFIAATIMICVYFMVLTIIYTPGLANVPEGHVLKDLFTIGFNILTFFIVIFMLYINSFLMKQRKKELGLYGILGLEKRHVGQVMLWENILINGAALVLGIVSGCVFGWLIFLLLMKCIHVTEDSYFALPAEAFLYTTAIFIVVFILVLFINLLQVRTANPVDLLKGKNLGEKKVRFMIPATIIGLVILGGAYYNSLTVKNPFAALNQFFISVLLVITATYILFTAGSVALLKLMKKRDKYYYRAHNFISISGMIHRMRQNASGLATICILSTMVLVTVSTTTALFWGQEYTLTTRFKDDITIQVPYDTSEEDYRLFYGTVEELSIKNDIKVEVNYRYFSIKGTVLFRDNEFTLPDSSYEYIARTEDDVVMANIILLEDYNRLCDLKEALADNELLLLAENEYSGLRNATIGSRNYIIRPVTSDNVFMKGKNGPALYNIYFVTEDMEAANKLANSISSVPAAGNMNIIMDIDGNIQDCLEFVEELRGQYKKDIKDAGSMSDIYSTRKDSYSMDGGLLFIGAFFAILFLSTTVLIIYFKQISEGYDDKERFETLQKVGMDDQEVKKTINKQILAVFFLPLFGALLHVAMVTHMLIKMLEIFWLYNVTLTVLCVVISCTIFTVVYIIVYRLTASTYYRIVKW